MDIISGEIIQMNCNHFIGNQKDFDSNPKIKHLTDRFIYIDTKEIILNSYKVYCCTHHLLNIDKLFNLLALFQNEFILFFHNSDTNFQKQHLKLFQIKNLKQIFTQNMNVIHPNVYPLPIGFANEKWPHGNLNIIEKYRNMKKNKYIFFNFAIKTNKAVRKNCYKAVKRLEIPFIEKLSIEDYFKELSQYQFSICPQGNGIDTHRFWECIYYKVVPIVKRCILTEYYSKYFPIIILDDWKDIGNLDYEKVISLHSNGLFAMKWDNLLL